MRQGVAPTPSCPSQFARNPQIPSSSASSAMATSSVVVCFKRRRSQYLSSSSSAAQWWAPPVSVSLCHFSNPGLVSSQSAPWTRASVTRARFPFAFASSRIGSRSGVVRYDEFSRQVLLRLFTK
nr:uncharacterized protein LOC127303472 [Lolium perenne]